MIKKIMIKNVNLTIRNNSVKKTKNQLNLKKENDYKIYSLANIIDMYFSNK